MAEDGPAWWDTALNGLLVLVGVGWVFDGQSIFGIEPLYVGGALAGYGAISYLGKRVAYRYDLFDRN